MPDYIRDNPWVLAAMLLAGLTGLAMAWCSLISYRFLRALRREAQPFWVQHLGRRASIGMLRLAQVTPPAVARLEERGMLEWQVVDGAASGRLIRERAGVAKLVTVHFFDE